jgi:hypothetical protein
MELLNILFPYFYLRSAPWIYIYLFYCCFGQWSFMETYGYIY